MRYILLTIALLLLTAPVLAQEVTTEVAFPLLTFRRPLYITHPRDGTDRLFVVEQDGRVFWFDNRPDVTAANPALDIRSRVLREGNEEGLLGLAFHPNFATNRYVFLHYSAGRPRRNVISRFVMDARRQRILPESEHVILEVAQPFSNHNGGMIEFGPDGMLYIALGDGGSGGDPQDHGQNRGTLLSTILRIDVDQNDGGRGYTIPRDNPFVGDPNARGEIWAYGLRNAWRFSFDRKTGDLWAGDVGQNLWEEIDLIEKGGNYGWRIREGAHSFAESRHKSTAPLIDPVVEHARHETWSITGGYVYRGAKFPQLDGAYIYGDYGSGLLWLLRYDTTQKKIIEHAKFGRVPEIASFGEDRDGEIYICSFDGRIHKIVAKAP